MKGLPILPSPPGLSAATRSVAATFPSSGAYVDGPDLLICANNIVWLISGAAHLVEELAPPTAPPQPVTVQAGVSELTLLRALALIQQPDLIKDMK